MDWNERERRSEVQILGRIREQTIPAEPRVTWLSQRKPEQFGEVLNRNSGKVPSSHRKGAYCGSVFSVHDYSWSFGENLPQLLESGQISTISPGSSADKESACNAGDPSLIPGLGRSPGEGLGYPLQYSCLENPHGQRSLVGYISQDGKELAEQLSTHTNHLFIYTIKI